MTTISGHTTRAPGTILTAAIYNADHVNHITNAQALNATKLEGATPPVVDGQAVLWSGTSGAALRTAGYVPANAADLPPITASLATKAPINNPTFTGIVTVPTQFTVQAQGGSEGGEIRLAKPPVGSALASDIALDVIVDQLRIFENGGTFRGVFIDWTTLPAGIGSRILTTNDLASQAEAEAGTNNTKVTTPLRVAQAIAALVPSKFNAFTGFTNFDSGNPWNTGITSAIGGMFWLKPSGAGSLVQCSVNGGTNYTNLSNVNNQMIGLVIVRGNFALHITWDGSTTGVVTMAIATLTAGAGNIFFKCSSANGVDGVRVI
jgi:hypothetical protein